ncbi:MAG: TolC family protein, partial [Rhodobacterales bacterium]
ASLKNQIAVLSGQLPGQTGINLDHRTAQPRVSMSPQMGIPADLLRNRPDIRVAERNYHAALREVKGAEAALYPQLSLGGTLSLASLAGNRSTDSVFGPALRLPLLPKDAQRATVALREPRVRPAHTSWKLAVIAAIGDVKSALTDYAAAQQAGGADERTVGHYAEVARLPRDSVAQDGGTIRDLIDAKQSLAFANAGLANATRTLGRSYIALNINLGAGHWATTGRLAAKETSIRIRRATRISVSNRHVNLLRHGWKNRWHARPCRLAS